MNHADEKPCVNVIAVGEDLRGLIVSQGLHRIDSIQLSVLPNLWTEDPSVPFSLQFGSILTSLCGDEVFFFALGLRSWVTFTESKKKYF